MSRLLKSERLQKGRQNLKKIYRIMLPKQARKRLMMTYPIGYNSTFTGFWTTSWEDAKSIYREILDWHGVSYNQTFDNVILSTTIDNVSLIKDFSEYKFYDNKLFDANEIFVDCIFDESKVSVLRFHF